MPPGVRRKRHGDATVPAHPIRDCMRTQREPRPAPGHDVDTWLSQESPTSLDLKKHKAHQPCKNTTCAQEPGLSEATQ
eukprot:4637009-Prymnesium_polylepis.1